jgi:hypothetical protein
MAHGADAKFRFLNSHRPSRRDLVFPKTALDSASLIDTVLLLPAPRPEILNSELSDFHSILVTLKSGSSPAPALKAKQQKKKTAISVQKIVLECLSPADDRFIRVLLLLRFG